MSEPKMVNDGHEFTEGQRAIIRQTAFEVGEVVTAKLKEQLDDKVEHAVTDHEVKCDAKKMLAEARGAWKVIAAVAACAGAILSAIIGHYWK